MSVAEYIDTVTDCGRRSAECRWRRDEVGAGWWGRSARQIITAHKGMDRAKLEDAFRDGYKAAWIELDLSVRPN